MKTFEVATGKAESRSAGLRRYPRLLRGLLEHRGIFSDSAAEAFLHPMYPEHSHDPFLLADMDKAVGRIEDALACRERVGIFGDYDHDGIPGAVLLADYFRKAGADVRTYIPHRNKDGFGLSPKAVQTCADDGITLLITVDCGITAHEAAQTARKHGIDLIITDHHLATETLPKSYAVINPQRTDNQYPFTGLCGAGVAFKLVEALVSRGVGNVPTDFPETLLDLLAISTIGDMVPLLGENRVFVTAGLSALRKTRRSGLVELMRTARLNPGHLSEDDVSFMVVPRINAASRMDTPEAALRVLEAGADDDVSSSVGMLQKINQERKGAVAAMVKEIGKRVDKRDELPPVLVCGDRSWRPGLLGLAANTAVGKYKRPVFLWGGQGDILRGSCRSDGSVNVVELMQDVPDGVFEECGGHKYSGGFSIRPSMVHKLEPALSKAYESHTLGEADDGQDVEWRASLGIVSWENYAHIEQCGPFGTGNPKPLFCFNGVMVNRAETFGSEQNHLTVTFSDDSARDISAIAFFKRPGDFDVSLAPGNRVDVLAHIEKSVFRGRPELRLRIVDILPAEGRVEAETTPTEMGVV